MKQFLTAANSRLLRIPFYLLLLCSSFIACKKTDVQPSLQSSDANDAAKYSSINASKYSSDVIDKWLTIQLRLIRNTAGLNGLVVGRYYAYSGTATFLAIVPGISKNSFNGKLNGLVRLPQANKSSLLYLPACVNTALATMNRDFFTTASDADKAAIDSLEKALNNYFLSKENPRVIALSNAFGKVVADAVFNWAETDGYKHANDTYTPPVGPGLWEPTPPTFSPPLLPYWGNNRPLIAGSGHNTQPGPPTPYSEDPKSPFFKMAKEVYDVSQDLTPDQIAMAIFWRDGPGYTPAGHWISILQQVLQQTNSPLDKAAFAYALTGICINDATISCWITRYHYNLVRPVTYIQNVMGYTTWNSIIPTPAHPEYTSAHTAISVAAAKALTAIYGDIGSFTDHTYDYQGMAPRTYKSFCAIALEVSISRLYAGIHYHPSLDVGIVQGRKVANNILNKLGLHQQDDE